MASSNVTIDDTNGDPTTGNQVVYSPADYWKLGPTCGTCTAKPNATLAYEHTWRDTSYIPNDGDPSLSAEVSFSGTAVYVYGIIAFGNSEWVTTDLQFLVDGQAAGSYAQENTNGTGFQYNTLYFSKQGLSPTNHTLTILNGANKGPQASIILLDRIVYTQEQSDVTPPSTGTSPSTSGLSGTPSPSTSSASAANNNRSVIIGSVIGVIAGLAILAALFFYCKRHRSKGLGPPKWGTNLSNVTTPFPLSLSSNASSGQSESAAKALVPSPSLSFSSQSAASSPPPPQMIASQILDPPSNSTTYGASEKRPQEDLSSSVQTQMDDTSSSMRTPMDDTAMLIAEVQRLREENERLQPPPYLQ